MSLKFWVPGNPAPFATQGEKPWKEALLLHLPQCPERLCARGLVIEFYLADLAPRGHPLDVDNLCEPVFSILINRKGWFGGRRPNLTWWRASKHQCSATGCQIQVFSNEISPIGIPKGVKVYEGHYWGPLPSNARDPCISQQIQGKLMGQKQCLADRYSVLVRFWNTKLNIGDIATGKVKTTIDSLYPAIGGDLGQPEDWKIDILQVEKCSADSLGSGVRISIWRLD